ncbi:hypothetical protein C8F01DRAFT_1342677 [Mycena amicta]|nr:hypothetical protein C8F01DRAFT_1342677 [Mycena amicta]
MLCYTKKYDRPVIVVSRSLGRAQTQASSARASTKSAPSVVHIHHSLPPPKSKSKLDEGDGRNQVISPPQSPPVRLASLFVTHASRCKQPRRRKELTASLKTTQDVPLNYQPTDDHEQHNEPDDERDDKSSTMTDGGDSAAAAGERTQGRGTESPGLCSIQMRKWKLGSCGPARGDKPATVRLPVIIYSDTEASQACSLPSDRIHQPVPGKAYGPNGHGRTTVPPTPTSPSEADGPQRPSGIKPEYGVSIPEAAASVFLTLPLPTCHPRDLVKGFAVRDLATTPTDAGRSYMWD